MSMYDREWYGTRNVNTNNVTKNYSNETFSPSLKDDIKIDFENELTYEEYLKYSKPLNPPRSAFHVARIQNSFNSSVSDFQNKRIDHSLDVSHSSRIKYYFIAVFFIIGVLIALK